MKGQGGLGGRGRTAAHNAVAKRLGGVGNAVRLGGGILGTSLIAQKGRKTTDQLPTVGENPQPRGIGTFG